MLVLTRKAQEAVVVGGTEGVQRILIVRVLEIRGGTVKLGFEADERIPVHRLEIWERIQGDDRPGTPVAPVVP